MLAADIDLGGDRSQWGVTAFELDLPFAHAHLNQPVSFGYRARPQVNQAKLTFSADLAKLRAFWGVPVGGGGRVAGLVKARQVKATKGGFRALPGFGNNQNTLFNNNLAKKANKKLATLAKRRAALVKARGAKKMHAKNLPGWYNVEGEIFGGNKKKAALHAANKTVEKVNKVEGVTNTTANAAANAAAAAAKAVTPSNASSTNAANIANAASAGATSAVQALPVNVRNNKNAVAAAAAAGASQAANAAKHGNSTPSESKNIGAAAGTAVTNAKKLKVN